jgi:hypothetical protein
MASRFVCWVGSNRCQVPNRQKVTACLTWASGANCLPTTCFLTGLQRRKSLGSTLSTGLVICHCATARRLLTTLSTVLVSSPEISIGTAYDAHSWKANYSRRLSEAICHLMVLGTWHRFIIRRDTNVGATVVKMLKYQLWQCARCFPCAMNRSNSE